MRKPAVAGLFYPSDPRKLNEMISRFITEADIHKQEGTVKAVVVPHAGYVYSGSIAGISFAQLLNNKTAPETIWILGPSHFYPFKGASTGPFCIWQTPLGNISVNVPLVMELASNSTLITTIQEPHLEEHSIEVELPFLQHVLAGNFRILPLCLGYTDPQSMGDIIIQFLSPADLIVVSTDLSHYHIYEVARQLDEETIKIALQNDWKNLLKREACGRVPWSILAYIASKLNWTPKLLAYSTSAEASGDYTSVVGYASLAYYS